MFFFGKRSSVCYELVEVVEVDGLINGMDYWNL